MSHSPWRLNRRTMLRGSGLSLALPLLDAMRPAVAAAATAEPPKRLVVCYFSYGAYMPKADDGGHHPWNWFPCSQPGPLSFNESAAPFQPLAESVSYFRGLDHAGGWKLGARNRKVRLDCARL